MTKVSVIIPTYNRANYLEEAIQSVLDQTFQDFELIVVDDGSTDNTREIVENFNDTRIRYIYKENGGVSSARNTGIKAAEAEYIAFLDSDDIWLPVNLELKVKLLDSRPDIGLVCSDGYYFDNNTGAVKRKLWSDPMESYPRFDPVRATRQPLKELIRKGCFIMPQASMIRQQVFAEVGYFDESLTTYEDWNLFVRVVHRFSVEIIDMPLLNIRCHSASLSQNQEKDYQAAVVAFNKVMNSGSLSREELNLLKKRLTLEHLRYGRRALLGGRKTAARKALLTSIRINPWGFRSYIYLALSLLGSRWFIALKSWRKSPEHHSVNCQASKGKYYIGRQSCLK